MLTLLPGYQIDSLIQESSNSFMYRGYREVDAKSVILKVLKPDYCTPSELSRYQREYRIIGYLENHGIVRALNLEKYQNTLILILEDFPGKPLSFWIKNKKLTVYDFLKIAIQLTEVVGQIHERSIIHQNLNPTNIFFDPNSGKIKILDFGMALEMNRDYLPMPTTRGLEEQLAYVSPEQTGRMNRVLDYRTDFYSLGVTFYELLVGYLPFDSIDPMELIHSHLALTPKSPHQIYSKLPKAVSDIIMKMLEKNPEDRYQSAWGIEADLVLCLMQFEATGLIEDLVPGENDVMRNFEVSSKFYGRTGELDQLLQALDRMIERTQKVKKNSQITANHDLESSMSPNMCESLLLSRPEVFLIEGEAGIGKSTFLAEISRSLAQKKVYFIDLQFSLEVPEHPFGILLLAFQDFIKRLLTETDGELLLWKNNFLKAIGDWQSVAIKAIPELQLILGEFPLSQELIASQSEPYTLKFVLYEMAKILGQSQYPVVIFLDDLQWIDTESLDFFKRIIQENTLQNILIIGSYRTLKYQDKTSISILLESIRSQGWKLEISRLEGLELENVCQLVADTLNNNIPSVQPLGSVILKKTQGHPLYIHKLLKNAYSEKKLLFDNNSLSWQWDLKKIDSMEIAENVVISTLEKLYSLSDSTQETLKLASCLGLSFDLYLISRLSQQSESETLMSIEEALKAQLITSKDQSEQCAEDIILECHHIYQFIDPKIRDRIHGFLDETFKKKTSLAISKISLEFLEKRSILPGERIFKIADHCNDSSELVETLEEKLKIANINLKAAQQAKALMKYDIARSYTISGISLVPEEIWMVRQDLAFRLHKERAEIEYLNGNIEGARILVQYLIGRSNSTLEKSEFENILILQYTLASKYDQALELGTQSLESLGFTLFKIDWSSELKESLENLQNKLSSLKIETLKNQPILRNQKLEMIMKILRSLESPAAFIDPTLLALTIVKMVDVSISYGNSPESATAYAAYGMLQNAMFNNPTLGYQFATLGVDLSTTMGSLSHKCQACMRLGVHIAPWSQPFATSLAVLEDGINAGLESNEFQFTGYSLAYKVLMLFYSGRKLKDILFEIIKNFDFCRKHKNQWSINLIESVYIPIVNLCGKTENKSDFSRDFITEEEFLKTCITHQNKAAIASYCIHKARILYLYEDYEDAWQCLQNADSFIDSICSTITVAEYQFYKALILSALYASESTLKQTEYLPVLESIRSKMLLWAETCPANFQSQYLLVSAEMAVIQMQYFEAINLYDRAIQFAREQEWVYGEALASERAALFWLRQGNHKIATVYLQDAYRGYQQWEAVRKVEDLEQKYAYLLIVPGTHTEQLPIPIRSVPSVTYSQISGFRSGSLDLATVIKAAQVLSGEIEIRQLLDKLMQMVIANAGATSGFLILAREEGLTIEAATIAGSEAINFESTPIQNSNQLPLSIIKYVARTQESVVANDATHESDFASDFYIQSAKPKSILCAPIQGQGKLIGIVYLENNLATGAFTRDRLDVLMLLCAQGAIALENARLYKTLQTSETREREKAQQLKQSLQDLQEAQLKLIQGEKMATLGQLVAGVAHEINNPVGFIAANISHANNYFEDLMGLLELYQEIYPDSHSRIEEEIKTIDLEFLQDDLPKILKSMEIGISRIRQISKALRTFSRNDEVEKVAVNLHDGIDSTLMILKHRLKANHERPEIKVIRNYGNLPEVKCFAGPINQVFMNLFANAIDALEESNQEKTYAEIDENPNRIQIRTDFDSSRQTVIIEIADNGLGMSEEIKQKVFDHLFTTKPVGKGTGLGLSISRQIVVEKHGGILTCQSTLGQGTTFTIEIPSV